MIFTDFEGCTRPIYKPGIYGSGRVWAYVWDVFRRTPSRGDRGRWGAVDFVVCFGCGGISFFYFSEDTQSTVSTIGEVNEARRPQTSSRPRTFEEKKTKKTTRNPAALKTHHEIHGSLASTTTSRRRATKHVPRVSPYSPAYIYPGFVEIDLLQLSQSVKTTNVIHTQTDRQTNFFMKN